MKLVIIAAVLGTGSSSIWLNNLRSKDATAIESGRQCLSVLSGLYFKAPWITRTLNMAVMHTVNLSSPSAEIQNVYLLWLHRSIANGEFFE